jgi:hypothetical protein
VLRAPFLHAVAHTRAALGSLLGRPLRALLQAVDLLGGAIPRGPVRLDGFFAVGRELGLPVALAALLLGERVLLVAVVVDVGF